MIGRPTTNQQSTNRIWHTTAYDRLLATADYDRQPHIDINLYPDDIASSIDDTNEWVYELINNGVYRCGFSTVSMTQKQRLHLNTYVNKVWRIKIFQEQRAYDRASSDVRRGLERCERILSRQPFLCGETFTEADLRLLPTILRYDGVYGPLFKAGGVHLRIKSDYPNLFLWLQRCWNLDCVPDSIDLNDATSSYYKQLFPLNPGGILPTGITPADIGLE